MSGLFYWALYMYPIYCQGWEVYYFEFICLVFTYVLNFILSNPILEMLLKSSWILLCFVFAFSLFCYISSFLWFWIIIFTSFWSLLNNYHLGVIRHRIVNPCNDMSDVLFLHPLFACQIHTFETCAYLIRPWSAPFNGILIISIYYHTEICNTL